MSASGSQPVGAAVDVDAGDWLKVQPGRGVALEPFQCQMVVSLRLSLVASALTAAGRDTEAAGLKSMQSKASLDLPASASGRPIAAMQAVAAHAEQIHHALRRPGVVPPEPALWMRRLDPDYIEERPARIDLVTEVLDETARKDSFASSVNIDAAPDVWAMLQASSVKSAIALCAEVAAQVSLQLLGEALHASGRNREAQTLARMMAKANLDLPAIASGRPFAAMRAAAAHAEQIRRALRRPGMVPPEPALWIERLDHDYIEGFGLGREAWEETVWGDDVVSGVTVDAAPDKLADAAASIMRYSDVIRTNALILTRFDILNEALRASGRSQEADQFSRLLDVTSLLTPEAAIGRPIALVWFAIAYTHQVSLDEQSTGGWLDALPAGIQVSAAELAQAHHMARSGRAARVARGPAEDIAATVTRLRQLSRYGTREAAQSFLLEKAESLFADLRWRATAHIFAARLGMDQAAGLLTDNHASGTLQRDLARMTDLPKVQKASGNAGPLVWKVLYARQRYSFLIMPAHPISGTRLSRIFPSRRDWWSLPALTLQRRPI